jgi:PAS domain S-box-containing protein
MQGRELMDSDREDGGKPAEEILRESKARVSQKPDRFISPEGDIGTLELSDIIDKQALQRLMDDFTRLTGMVTAILDSKGNVLVATGWQPICTRFHRIHPVTAQYCTESDLYLAKNMKRGEYVAYKCKNNLWDVVTPLYIGNRHMGNIFTGQFFYDDEIIDEFVFIAQADMYGFDREEYLTALRNVPRFSRDKVNTLMDYLVQLTDFISKLSYSNLTLAWTVTERDALFTSLKKSEERLRITLDATNDGIWDWNISTGMAFFSPRWYSMIGYEPGELPGTYATWRSLLHPEDLGPAEQKIQSHIVRENESYSVEFRMQTKQGDWKWILARGKVVERDNEGKPVRMVGTQTDISERKRIQEELSRKHEELMASYEQITASEEELRESYDEVSRSEQILRISEGRLVMAQEIGHTGCWEYSFVTNTIWGSAEGLRMFGFPSVAKDVPVEEIESRITERERAHQALVDLITKGQEYDIEYTINPADGSSPRVVHSVARLDRDPQGNPVRVVGVIKDITERKRADMALQESEQKFRNLYQYAQVGLFETSLKDGTVVACNERYALLAGYSSVEDARGKDIVHLYTNTDDRKEVSRILHEQGHIDDHILALKKHLTGVPFWVQFSARINRENDVAEGSIIDITERKLAELELFKAHRDLEKKVIERTRELSDANERLKELDRLKSMFIASMSHELRTPLNSIIGFTGIMVKGMTGEINPEQKKQLGMVQGSARHLLALINDVIDISKIEAGKIDASVSSFDLADVLHEVENTMSSAAADQGLALNIEIPQPIPVTSDERRIRQIIFNLVSNAIKFTDEGRVDVTVQRKGKMVEISVKDTGIGIGREDLAQLFRPFVRVQVPGRLTEGTGLGLYLSKKIARFLGGDITGESELHKGSVFTFTFPVSYQKQEENS